MDSAIAGASDLSRYGRRIVKMIWDPEPTNDTEANLPVWCLGRSYKHQHVADKNTDLHGQSVPADTTSSSHRAAPIPTPPPADTRTTSRPPLNGPDTPPDSAASSYDSSLAYGEVQDGGWPPAFIEDFESRVWLTYRSGFLPIPKSSDPKAASQLSLAMRLKTLADQNGFPSDSGWGCMIRSGQSLLANTLSINRLGRDWRRSKDGEEERGILSLFADDPRAPYSIHSFVNHGAACCGKVPGEWFGPSATARCIQALANGNEQSLRVYATGDARDVYEDTFMETAKPEGHTFHPTLILVGTRLGIDKVNPVYWEPLTAALQMPQSVGIAGGRPSASHYFVGAQRSGDEHDQGSYLFYLDPHHTRPALPYHEDLSQYTSEDLDSCHTRRLRRLHVREMDPSMLIGFLIRDEEDWNEWKNSVKYVQGKSIISVQKNDPSRGPVVGREEAIDEVETLSDDDGDTILNQ